jgi:hypothetical protein
MKTLPALLVLASLLAALPATAAPPAPPEAPDAIEPECAQIYRRTDVENVAFVMTSSCSAAVYWCATPGAPTNTCKRLASTPGSVVVPEPTGDCIPLGAATVCYSLHWPGCNLSVHAAGQDVCLYRTGPVVQSSAAADQCVTVYDFPDMGWRVCADVWAEDCALYEYRATFLGTERNCIGPAVPGATCGPYLGPVQPCVNPRDADCLGYVNQNALPMVNPVCLVDASLSAGAASPPPCYDIYRRTDVHTFTLVQRNSCSAEAYTCPTPGAPLDQCQPLVSQAAAVAGAPEPQCLQYYRETEVGPYRHVQRNSCESEHYLCDEEAVPYLLMGIHRPRRSRAGLVAAGLPPRRARRTAVALLRRPRQHGLHGVRGAHHRREQ